MKCTGSQKGFNRDCKDKIIAQAKEDPDSFDDSDTFCMFSILSGKSNPIYWACLVLLPVQCVSREFFFFFFELEKTLGTRMEHSAVMLTHRSISSTLNQVSPHGTVWTNQIIQSQFTTPSLDSHCILGFLQGHFLFVTSLNIFSLTENFVTSTLFSPGYSDGRREATNVCFLYQEQ